MFITIEPGVYTEGSHGVRTENSVVVRKDIETEYGQFYRFETFTVVPIDTDCLDLALMNDEEIQWLNDYHKHVYEKVSPLVSETCKKMAGKENTANFPDKQKQPGHTARVWPGFHLIYL